MDLADLFFKFLIDRATRRHRITRHIIVYRVHKPWHRARMVIYGVADRLLFFERKLFSDKFIDGFGVIIYSSRNIKYTASRLNVNDENGWWRALGYSYTTIILQSMFIHNIYIA